MAALITELAKLGFVLRENGRACWSGTGNAVSVDDSTIDTYDDHRMAMSMARAVRFNPLRINDPMVVTKSYPTFWEDLKQAGFTIQQK